MITTQNRFKSWYQQEKEKLRALSWKKRVGYLLHYYRGWLIGLIVLICVGFYIGDMVAQSQKEVVLQGFFTNDEWNLFSAEELQKDYQTTLSLQKNESVVFDDSLYIDLGGKASDYTAASNGKIIAYMATHELDFIVTSSEVMQHYQELIPLKDLNEILPDDLKKALQNSLVPTFKDGKTVCLALDMTQSRFVAGIGVDQDPAITDTYYLLVPASAPHTAQLTDFIRYCFNSTLIKR